MKIRFFSDPHLGVNRRANTTSASRVRIKEQALQTVSDLVTTEEETVCVGDFFDTFSNNEEDIVAACAPFSQLKMCLAGNHDVVNDNSKKGSLDVLAEVFPSVVVPRVAVGEVARPASYSYGGGAVLIQAVPHHSSQQLFEEALQQAYDLAKASKGSPTKLLLLHCNYNLPEALSTDTALNLTEEDAEVLLEVFDYVLLGHEHTPSDHFGGRLLIVGNSFPTSFSDISNKRYLTFDPFNQQMESHPIWRASEGYIEIDATRLIWTNEPLLETSDIRFVKIVGAIPMESVKRVAQAIQSKLWKAYPDQILAIKDATTVLRDSSRLSPEGKGSTLSLPELLDSALKDTPMYELWVELLADYQESSND